MHLLIIGDYPVATQARMRVVFPAEWQLTIAAPDACAPHLADAEAVIPEHVLVDDAFLAQASRLRFVTNNEARFSGFATVNKTTA